MIVHLDGNLIDAHQANVSVFDRGFLFGDGIYEGLRATRGHIIGLEPHARRMARGLSATGIEGFDASRLGRLSHELLETNGLESAFIYWQVTRGVPADGASRPRFPTTPNEPTVFGFATGLEPVDELPGPAPKRAALIEDCRWTHGHLKSISLMGSVLVAREAMLSGRDDAIMHRAGLVTEGTATNIFLAFGERVATPSLDSAPMLEGVTRRLMLEAEPGVEERPVRVEELARATEVMLVGTRTMVASVVEIDGRPVGDGAPGSVARRMHGALVDRIGAETSPAASRGSREAHRV